MKNILQRGILRLARNGRLNWMPDKLYLQVMYIANMWKILNLKDPKTFNEKLQWLKLYDRKPEYTMMVDKYRVREYIAKTIGEEYLIPLLGVWEDPEDIDFGELPDQFVLKPTHTSGNVLICRDKADLNQNESRLMMKRWLKREYFWNAREWPYKNVKPRIIAEKMIDDKIVDYKFYCFNGEPRCLYLSKGLENHATASISFFDLELKRLPFGRSDFQPFTDEHIKPRNYEEMLEIARKLAEGFAFIRVDLYSVDGKTYFSELTHYPCAGYMPFEPEEWDYKLGEWIKLK